jgi:hypothetical protein
LAIPGQVTQDPNDANADINASAQALVQAASVGTSGGDTGSTATGASGVVGIDGASDSNDQQQLMTVVNYSRLKAGACN